MSKPRLTPLMFVPGMLFWVLLVAGLVTKNDVMIGAAIAIGVVTVITLVTLKIREVSAERAERRRIWRDGRPGSARVLAIGSKGGGINDHPEVELELEVSVGGQPAYRVTTRAIISQLAIPRIQPECQIAVKVDPQDAQRLVVDSALTPYGYG